MQNALTSSHPSRRSLDAWLNRVFGWAGLVVVPRWRLQRLSEAQFLQQLFSTYSVDCVIDVGANLGQYRDFLRNNVGYGGTILSFEPHPECAEQLARRSASDPDWEIFSMGLGAEDGDRAFFMTQSSQLSSFRVPDVSQAPHLQGHSQVSREQTVRIATLDTFAAQNTALSRARACFLKIDTQGYDLEVIRGAREVLERCVAVQTEASVTPIYEGIPDITETIQEISGYGFRLADAGAVNRKETLQAIDFDLVFVKSAV